MAFPRSPRPRLQHPCPSRGWVAGPLRGIADSRSLSSIGRSSRELALAPPIRLLIGFPPGGPSRYSRAGRSPSGYHSLWARLLWPRTSPGAGGMAGDAKSFCRNRRTGTRCRSAPYFDPGQYAAVSQGRGTRFPISRRVIADRYLWTTFWPLQNSVPADTLSKPGSRISKVEPGYKFNYGHIGIGSSGQSDFSSSSRKLTGIQMTAVPLPKGPHRPCRKFLPGRLDLYIVPADQCGFKLTMPKQIKVLAVTGEKSRLPVMPHVATLQELGVAARVRLPLWVYVPQRARRRRVMKSSMAWCGRAVATPQYEHLMDTLRRGSR